MPEDFNSRFSSKGKVYRYLILNAPQANPLLTKRALHIRQSLDIEAMSRAAGDMNGERDYACFGSKTAPEENTICDIKYVRVENIPAEPLCIPRSRLICIEVRGDRFLYKMVRTIAGTLLEIGRGRFSPEDISGIIESRDRARAGPTLKPHGLYLVEVIY